MDFGLVGQSIIVTGGSSGIGLRTARMLLEEGAIVTICGRDRERLEAALTELGSRQLQAVQADVLAADEAAAVVRSALEHGGRLDGVAAVAGRGTHGTLLHMTSSEVGAEVSNKLASLLNIVRPAAPHLVETAGRIVGLTAPTASRPDPAMGAVSAGRAALDSALSSLAEEFASSRVRVNAVGVGLIDTPRQEERHALADSESPYQEWLTAQAHERSVPLERAGTSTEVAAAICWLLSPVSSYTTGSVIDVTGGLRSR